MPKLIGAIAALVALATGILNSVDPIECVTRAGLAFVLGILATQVWYVFFTVRVSNVGIELEPEPEVEPEPVIEAQTAKAA